MCYALGVIVTNYWCFLYTVHFAVSISCFLCCNLRAYPLGLSHDQPLNLWTFSVWLNFQASESQFEAEVQWERLLTAKNTKVKIFATRFARELITTSPPTSSWAWLSGDCFRRPCSVVSNEHADCFCTCSTYIQVIGAGTGPAGPAIAGPFDFCVVSFPDWTAVAKFGRVCT